MRTLREARLYANKTQRDIERATGVPQAKISAEESGIRKLSVREMALVEQYLNIPINWNPQNTVLTNEQESELSKVLFSMAAHYGHERTLRYACKYHTPIELYHALCHHEDPLILGGEK